MFSRLIVAALVASQASAHFLLNYPPSIGFDDDNEGSAPCGGFTPDLATNTNLTDFHVGGDTIFLKGTHPTSNFLFRATTDSKASGNWTNLQSPIIVNGLGDSCQAAVPAPSSLAGSKGFIQIIAKSPDGLLYQCAAVNFVTGNGPTGGSGGCRNATGVSIAPVNDATLSGISSSNNGGGPAASSTSASSSSSSSAAAASSTSAGAAAGSVTGLGYGNMGTVAWMVLIAAGTTAVRLL